MAKTDWTIDDEVTPQDMNDIGQEINQLREDVDNIEVPPASTTKAGIVQLSNAVDSDSETLAATPKAVKHAYDHAEQAFQLGNERKSDLVDALIAIGVPASTGESWDSLLAKVGSVIRATGNADAGDVRAGRTFSNDSANGLVGNLPTRTGGNVVPGPSDIVKAAGIYDTPITVKGVSVPADKVLAGTTIAGTAGTMPNRAGDTAALSSQVVGTTLKLLASAGYRDGVDDYVTITDSDFVAANIRNGINLFGITGTLIEGKPFATGTTAISSSTLSFVQAANGEPTSNQYYLEITGLNFPNGILFIAIVHHNGSMFYVDPNTWPTGFSSYFGGTGYVKGWQGSGGGGTCYSFKHDRANAYVNNNGFRLPVLLSGGTSVMWFVWGK